MLWFFHCEGAVLCLGVQCLVGCEDVGEFVV